MAREKYSVPNVVFQEGRAEDIPGGDYDVVFSNSVLHWCKDKDTLFEEVAKSLKKGGMFGFVTPADFDAEEQFYTPANMVSRECRKVMVNDVHIVSSEKIRQLCSTNNFTVTYFHKHLREWVFKDVYKLIEFHMTHYKGQFDISHFNVEAMKKHYGEGEIIITIPYITVVATLRT